MRGWKVVYDPEQGSLSVGPTRGTPACLKIVGIGASPEGSHHYLCYHLDAALTVREEEAVLEYLGKHNGGSWDLVASQVLNPTWTALSAAEQTRILRREGFEPRCQLP